LVGIVLMAIGGYSSMVIGGYYINGYWFLFYEWLLVFILLMIFGGYSINDYWWLFY